MWESAVFGLIPSRVAICCVVSPRHQHEHFDLAGGQACRWRDRTPRRRPDRRQDGVRGGRVELTRPCSGSQL